MRKAPVEKPGPFVFMPGAGLIDAQLIDVKLIDVELIDAGLINYLET